MTNRFGLLLLALASAVLGCGGDRATGPDEAARAAAEFERAVADLGFAADPTAALMYQGTAAAIRGGTRVSQVDITVGGTTERWSAFGHEVHFEMPASSPPLRLVPQPMRAFVAWRTSPSGMRIIHLVSTSDEGALGGLVPSEPGPDVTLQSRSLLMYAEGRNLLWEAVSGAQTSSVAPSTTPCREPPRRAAGAPPPPACVEASFTFGFSDVEARPSVLPAFGPVARPPNGATGIRTLSMRPQTLRGVQLTITPLAFPFPLAGRARP